MKINRTFFLTHSKLECSFNHNSNDFFVEEIPLYEFTGEGEHLILKVRKKNMTTWAMLDALSSYSGCKGKDIGYAGLKDKDAITIQYISIHKRYEEVLEKFEHPQIKILEKTYHKNKIKLGHLIGNTFFIRLKKVLPTDKLKLDQAVKRIKKEGTPNFFGYQRFGNDRDNHIQGKKVVAKEIHPRPKLKKLFINAYQSYLFNNWLSKRIEVSHIAESLSEKELISGFSFTKEEAKDLKKQQQFFKIFDGDLFCHYPHGRLFNIDNTQEESEKFLAKDRVPTGILSGKTRKAERKALEFEEKYDEITTLDGDRRYAWIFPTFEFNKYIEEKAWYELKFSLPKGSYATSMIEELLHRRLDEE